MRLARILAGLVFALAASASAAADWRYTVGVHDFFVPDVDSHTYGLNGSVSVDSRTTSGRHLFGSVEIFLDRDKDHLDPDHIPVWWQLHLGSDGDFWRGDRGRVGWTANIDTRINTASGIERQITALPALVGGYDGRTFQASLETGVGYFFLEIDDDAPQLQGYDRSGLRNTTFAYAATGRLALKLSESWAVSGMARTWWNNQGTLETQYRAALRMDARNWFSGGSMKQPALILSADYYRYNLDIYNKPNLPPVLRWDDDLMIRLQLEVKW